MSFDLNKMFKDLEVKYGDSLKDAFKSGYCNITLNVGKDDNKCDCGECCSCDRYYEDVEEDIQEPVTKIEMGNLDPIIADNAVTATSLRAYNEIMAENDCDCCDEDEEDEVEEEPVKLINVNKNVSKALETIYDVILEVNEDGETYVSFDLVEEFPELFKNVRDVTMNKVLNRISRHLSENGFDVETHSETNEYDNKVEKVYTVDVSW